MFLFLKFFHLTSVLWLLCLIHTMRSFSVVYLFKYILDGFTLSWELCLQWLLPSYHLRYILQEGKCCRWEWKLETKLSEEASCWVMRCWKDPLPFQTLSQSCWVQLDPILASEFQWFKLKKLERCDWAFVQLYHVELIMGNQIYFCKNKLLSW